MCTKNNQNPSIYGGSIKKYQSIMALLLVFFIYLSIPSVALLKIAIPSWTHYVLYSILFIVLFPVFDRDFPKVYLFTCLFGISDETLQWITPGRFFEVSDILHNWQGASIGMLIMAMIQTFKRKSIVQN